MFVLLLVEDDEEVRQVYADILMCAGYQVDQAADGYQALQKYRENYHSLVLIDVLMPSKDGIETILELRKRSSEVPIIALSGGGCISAVDCLKFAAKCGADKTFVKPVSRQDLLSAVETLLAKTSLA